MESDTFSFEFTWLPSETDLPDVISFFESKEHRNFGKCRPHATLRSFLSRLFNLSVQTTDFKRKFVLGYSENNNSVGTSKSPIYMFFANYLYQVCSTIILERKFNSCVSNIDERRRLIKTFCSLKPGCPELWLNVDVSDFIEDNLSTIDHFIDLKKFSLGNIVKLNKFVEHFSSDSSLNQYNHKITQVKVKFLHDEQVMHMYFVVGNEKVSFRKRSPESHRMHKLVIPYSSLHTILVCHEKNVTVYFHLNTSPMLFAVVQDEEAEDYISYCKLNPNTNWIRSVDLFNGCPLSIGKEFSMNYVLQLCFCSENYEVFKIIHHHKNVQIYFSPMHVIPYEKVPLAIQFNNFDCHYGLHCLLSHSYEIHDQLMDKDELNLFKKFVGDKCTEKEHEALSEAFHIIFSAVSQCNVIVFNHSLKALYERLSKSNMQDKIKNPNLLKVRKAIIVPTHVRFIPPQLILQSRALRDSNPDYSLRISIRDVNMQTINFSFKGASKERKESLKNFFETYFKKTMLNGIKIGKRRYEYVGSSTSQLKGHGLWFYAKDTENKTAGTLRKTFGDMEKIKQVPKFMARMGQTFSQSQGNIIIPQEYTNVSHPDMDIKGGKKIYLEDEDLAEEKKFLKSVSDSDDGIIEDDDPYTFSDGIGRMSLETAERVYKKLGLEESRPSAMQIRYAGCKGMLVVDPNLVGKKIVFRESMKKFSSDSDSLEILKCSEKRTAALNRPLITILEQLGVPKNAFIQLQKQMIQSHIRSMFHETDAYEFLHRNSKVRFNFTDMHKAGFRFTEDPLFRSMTYGLFRKKLDLLITKANIEIPPSKGRSMFGVLDETFTLEYGQVFIQYTDWDTEEAIIYKGTVIVTKNPCMHPGDVRKFEAVDVEDLHHIRDCIVFPAKGGRPHPDEMAGSDLDGDEYEIMFLKDFVFPKENYEPMAYSVRKDETKEKDNIQPSDELDHLCEYIIYDNVGLIANAHLVFADKERKGIYGENCLRLAKKYAMALDFAKSGVPAVRNEKDRIFTYPDFMQKLAEKPTYVSKKALGVLYRSCKKLEMGLEASSCGTEYKPDPDLEYENWEEYKEEALNMYKNYCRKVEYLINIYSFDNEGELLAGAIINTPKYYDQRHDLDNLKSLLEHEIQWIFSNLEKQFFNEFGGKPKDRQYTRKMYQKASAWYVVAYHNILGQKHQYFGFPWAVSDVLAKLKSEKCIHRGHPVANIKSRLEEIVDESLRCRMPVMSDETHVIYENRWEVVAIAEKVLTRWLKSLRDLLLPDLKKFEKILHDEFKLVSEKMIDCDIQYIENLKKNNEIKKAISPCYYIIETLLNIADIKVTNDRIPFTNAHHELGILSWVTLIKLACSYNPQYLGIADKDGNYASSMFYVPQDNVVSTFRLHLFEKKEANQQFSTKLLNEPEKVIKYLKKVTDLKQIEFRYDVERDKEYVAIFTVRGTRYAIEKLKDIIVLDEFFSLVVKGQTQLIQS